MTLISRTQFFKGLAKLKTQKARRYAWTTMLATQYIAMTGRGQLPWAEPVQHAPDIIIAGLPIWNVNKIGHASSDEILKYRSMGGVFLAHQKGGKHTFKFTAHFFGPIRYILTKLLEGILIIGSESAEKIGEPKLNKIDLKVDESGTFTEGLKISSAPLIRYSNKDEFDEERYMFHKTFPIITETKIYTDMYMETMVTRQSTKLGIETVEVTCAFRQYLAPTHFQKASVLLRGEKAKAEKYYYRTFIPRNHLSWLNRVDHGINILWALMQYQADMEYDKDYSWYEKQRGRQDWEVANLAQTFATFSILRMVKYGGK